MSFLFVARLLMRFLSAKLLLSRLLEVNFELMGGRELAVAADILHLALSNILAF